MADDERSDELKAVESIKKLLQVGVELGVAEATRRLATLAAPSSDSAKKAGVGALLGSATVVEMIQFIKNDPGSVFHLAKEVWSRGGAKEKRSAADAIGTGLGFFVPHKAMDAARDLAAMARSKAEAVMVGRQAIGPVLERNPALLDRLKKFVEENERLIRQAAIAGLVGYIARKRKYTAVAVEVLLLVAQRNEKEIRALVKAGLKKIKEIDPMATARAVVDWVNTSPTKERIQAASGFLSAKMVDVRLAMERGVIGALAAVNGGPSKPTESTPKKRPTGRTRSRKTSSRRKPRRSSSP